jgi:hypothetical protein
MYERMTEPSTPASRIFTISVALEVCTLKFKVLCSDGSHGVGGQGSVLGQSNERTAGQNWKEQGARFHNILRLVKDVSLPPSEP